ncbi:hypothetical protein KIN20_017505 [Parelaphostrongylus tenuis]|uniref:Uncharacterized protein n=1 Tax=Parelaphostrongylus tenuis TaxID=148309 RepID=A0AAD5N6G3_PARTN|nr:hypothetical protein KIN20_017505 [Parelaphostrongylus tenuis]
MEYPLNMSLLSELQSKLVQPNCSVVKDDRMGLVTARYTCNHTNKCNNLVGFMDCVLKFNQNYSAQLVLEAVDDSILPAIKPVEGARSR